MPEIPAAAVIALCVVAGLIVYGLAWRATRSGSFGVKVLVRGGLVLLIAVPLAASLVLAPSLKQTFKNVDSQLPGAVQNGDGTKKADAPKAKMRRDHEDAVSDAVRKEAERATGERMRAEKSENGVRPFAVEPSAPPAASNGPGAPRGGGEITGVMPSLPLPAAPTVPTLPAPALDSALPDVLPVPDIPEPPEAMTAAPPPDMAPPPAPERDASTDGAAAPEAPAAANGEAPSTATRSVAAAKEEQGWDVVPVFFGTDRQEEPNPKRVAYSSERGRRLELGRALVTVPDTHKVPQIERPWAIRIPYFDVTIYEEAEDRKRHFTIEEIKALTKEEFIRLVRERLKNSDRFKDHAIVFVHGYNTSFDHAIYRTAQISYDLKFDGTAFLYSWPSGGAVASYTYDRESAGASRPYLREFLDLVVKQSGAKTVSVIAHSMGSGPLLEVLKDMKSAAPNDVVISQIILAAPDVDADNFANLARRIEGLAKGVTLYAASNDRAMIASRSFWQNPRAGDVPASGPVIVPGVDTIDVTAASTDTLAINHSGYAEKNELLKDIGELIQTGLRPPDQRVLKPARVPTDKGDYWRYIAPPAATGETP